MMKRAVFLLIVSLSFSAAYAGESIATGDFRQIVQKAKDKVFPAVVYIKCVRESHESGQKVSEEVAGSGVIITETGTVLSNWHVVDKATEMRCLLFDGTPAKAKLIGMDKDVDLALLQLELEPDRKVPFAKIGDSTVLREGDFVMAMGAPWGLARSVSIGIISCTNRYLEESSQYNLWLQTDAAICPGNSGGPLVNTEGEVVGVNTLATLIGGDMGFAVPAEMITMVIPRLMKHGNANWSWTGLQLQPLRDFNKDMYFDGTEGVIVAETDPESPARRAGILARDRILAVNSKPVTALTEEALPAIRRRMGMLPKYEEATVEILRGDKHLTVSLTPREKGDVEGKELDCPRWDFTVKEINQFDNPSLFFYRKQGVFIYGIEQPGNALNAGLQEQDIVLQIDSEKVETLKDVDRIHKAALDNIDAKHRILLTVMRNGLMRRVVLDFARDYDKE